MEEVNLKTEEKSYKYLETLLKPFVNTLNQNIPQLSKIYTNKELLERFMKKFYYEYSKDELENLLLQQDKFYNLLIEVGRDKELLIQSFKIEHKIVINCASPDTLAESLVLVGKEYVDFIIYHLRNRVIWLVNEYNDLNFVKQYEIKDIKGNVINDTDKRCNNNI